MASDGLYYMFIDMFALQPKADRPGLFRTSNEYAVIIWILIDIHILQAVLAPIQASSLTLLFDNMALMA